MMEDYPIDAVITWVDGNDPAHRRKRAAYSEGVAYVESEDIGGETRFRSVGEIRWCVASIRRFAPFVRRIFVVTDGQDPGIDGVEIVDHKEIASGFEDYLPIFNSLGIETLLWRIPGLAERFIYFNDDFFITAPCSPEDFFRGDKIVCRARPFSIFLGRLLRALKPASEFGFKDAMLNAALLLGERRDFLRISHIPLSQRKSLLEEYFTLHPEMVAHNLKCRFRERSQFNPQELCYLLARRKGLLDLQEIGPTLYMRPRKAKGYVDGKLASFRALPQVKFCGINSLDLASEEDREKVLAWLSERIGG